LEEVSPRWETPLVGALTLGTSGIQLHAGEVRAYIAQESTSGEVEAWVEAKRTADDMEDMITVAGSRDTMGKRQARQVSYPRAGGGAGESPGGRPRVNFDADEEVIMRESPPMAESPGTLDYSPGPQEQEEDSESEEEAQKKTRRASRKAGTQRARRVPIKLWSEAQPEKMVDKILDQPIDRITMRELLGLSPDLLAEIWGVRRFPPFNKAAIPAMQATDMGAEAMAVAAEITEDKGKGKARLEAHTCGLPRGRRPAGGLRVLYACASPQFILGRPWERLARAQYDNRDDGSLYISITSLDSRRRAVFCAADEHSERNRDRVRIMHLESPAEVSGSSNVVHCRVISCDPLPRYYVRFTDGKEELVWEEEAMSGEVVTGTDMEGGKGVWDCFSGV